jgi:putative peptidoglycan lipid II flippase
MSEHSRKIAKSAGVISIATTLSRILGLVREQMIATLFSRTATDAFYVAFRIPNLLRDLFAEGAMSSAFVPTFIECLKNRGSKEAWKLASNVLNLLVLLLGAITILGIVFSSWIVEKFAGDFRVIPGKLELTVVLTQIMFPFLPLVAIAAVVMGILNSQGTFFLPALAPALFNVGSIVVALSLYWILTQAGWEPILGMAIGTLAGGFLQLAVQIPVLVRRGFTYMAGLSLGHPGVKRILLLMGPGTIGLASTQINILVNTWLATSQGEGPVSWLNYAFRLMQFPLGLFGVAIATATLPTLSAQVANQELPELQRTLTSSLKLVLLVNVPASAGLMALSQPIIALIFQHGRFKEEDTNATANALIFYAIGLFAYSAVKLLVPAFYALGRSRVPVIISTIAVALNIGLNLALVRPMGYLGLALGTSIAAIANFLLLFFSLQKYSGPMKAKSLLSTFFRVTLASIVMAAASGAFHRWLFAYSLADGLSWRAMVLGAAMALGVLVLLLMCRMLKVAEVNDLVAHLKSRLNA